MHVKDFVIRMNMKSRVSSKNNLNQWDFDEKKNRPQYFE